MDAAGDAVTLVLRVSCRRRGHGGGCRCYRLNSDGRWRGAGRLAAGRGFLKAGWSSHRCPREPLGPQWGRGRCRWRRGWRQCGDHGLPPHR
eukprot:6232004-Prymnesium_polylepis.2